MKKCFVIVLILSKGWCWWEEITKWNKNLLEFIKLHSKMKGNLNFTFKCWSQYKTGKMEVIRSNYLEICIICQRHSNYLKVTSLPEYSGNIAVPCPPTILPHLALEIQPGGHFFGKKTDQRFMLVIPLSTSDWLSSLHWRFLKIIFSLSFRL